MQQLIVLELLLWQGFSCYTESLPVPWRATNIPIWSTQYISEIVPLVASPGLHAAIYTCRVITLAGYLLSDYKPSCIMESHKYTDQTLQMSFDKGAIPCLLCAPLHNIDSCWVIIWQEIFCHTEKPSCTTESHKYTDQTPQISFDKGVIHSLLCASPHNIDSCWVMIWQEISCYIESLPVLRRVTNIPIRHHKYLLIKVPYTACYVPSQKNW